MQEVFFRILVQEVFNYSFRPLFKTFFYFHSIRLRRSFTYTAAPFLPPLASITEIAPPPALLGLSEYDSSGSQPLPWLAFARALQRTQVYGPIPTRTREITPK